MYHISKLKRRFAYGHAGIVDAISLFRVLKPNGYFTSTSEPAKIIPDWNHFCWSDSYEKAEAQP